MIDRDGTVAVRALCACLTGVVFSCMDSSAHGAELFRNQMTSGAGWGINASGPDSAATFGFNYGALGIPEAPNSLGGDTSTRGVKLEANIVSPGEANVFSLYPVGESFTGTYRLRFDAWCNYDVNEAVNGGSEGTTEFLGGGIGYDNTSADVGPGYQQLFTGDGGSGSDWRAFAGGNFLAAEDMEGGTRNGFDPYYSDFLPGVVPPLAQGQGGAAPPGRAGSPGFQWITVEIIAHGGQVFTSIEKPNGDRLKIVTYDTADYPGVSTDGNIVLMYTDYFTSVSPRPDLTFGIIDNVVVDEVPAPASAAAFCIGGLTVLRRRRAC